MRLAKQHIDIGVFTNRGEEMLRFWQEEVGLPYEEALATGGGGLQHRHGLNGSVFKLNVSRDPVPPGGWSGYAELGIAREGLSAPRELADPDGNRVVLVPRGHEGVEGIGIHLRVRSAAAHDDWFGRVLGLERAGTNAYRWGNTLMTFAEDAQAGRAGDFRGTPGFRYITVQVWDTNLEHGTILARGGEEGRPPVTLGTTARISFVRDPDGNWVEVSQRANLTGPLPP